MGAQRLSLLPFFRSGNMRGWRIRMARRLSGGCFMKIRDILRAKGSAVATARPDASVRELLGILAEHNIGAVVVSPDGTGIAGIVSERDVVRRMHERGADVLDAPVS